MGFLPKKLSLKNWCQHRELEFTMPSSGMLAIQGPNGVGKSNLLDALLFICANESNNLATRSSKTTDNITAGETEAKLVLDFDADGMPGTITAVLKRNYTCSWDVKQREIDAVRQKSSEQANDPSIKLDAAELALLTFKPTESTKFSADFGDRKYRNVTEVMALMAQLTGLTPAIIKETYFPKQGNVDAIISGDSATRMRVLSDQARTSLCPKIHDELGIEIRSLRDFGDIEKRVAEAEAALAVAKAAHANDVAVLDAVKALPVAADGAHDIVARWQAAGRVRTSLALNKAKLIQATEAFNKADAEAKALVAPGIELKARVEAAQSQANAAIAVIATAEAAVREAKRRATLMAQYESAKSCLDVARAKLMACVDPMPLIKASDAAVETLSAISSVLRTHTIDLKAAETKLALLKKGLCPTCGHAFDAGDVSAAEAAVAQLRAEQAKAQAAVAEAEVNSNIAKAACADAEHALSKAKSVENSCLSVFTSIESQVKAEAQQPEPATAADVDAAKAVIAAAETLKAELEAARQAYGLAYGTAETKRSEVAQLQAAINEALGHVEGAPSDDDYKKAVADIDTCKKNAETLRAAEIQAAKSKVGLDAAEAAVAAVHKEARDAAVARNWRDLLTAARDAFHRDNLPRQALLWYAAKLMEHTNSYLKMFNAPFALVLGDDMELFAVFNTRVMAARTCSGGEKNMLSLSLRLSMADLFPSRFNVLALDEVEVHLDQENVARLPAVLERVRGLSRNRGLTVLFISHHPSLADISDHVVTLQSA